MNIKKLIQAHPTFNASAEIKAICAPLKMLGIVYFSHAHIDKQNTLSGLGNIPEFVRLYFEKGYYNFDVHMNKALSGETYVLWDTVQRVKQSEAMHQDFMSFNQGHTFSIIDKHEGGTDAFHFAAKLGNDAMNGKYFQLLGHLKQFIQYFKAKVAEDKVLTQAYKLKIPLMDSKGSYQTNDVELGVNIEEFSREIQSSRTFIKNLNQYLTKRELECLQCLALGKTYEETANILNITTRTVKAHVTAVKVKMNCDTQFQLGVNFAKNNI
jgi:DNA-binding CsgD family transcriptional regulator